MPSQNYGQFSKRSTTGFSYEVQSPDLKILSTDGLISEGENLQIFLPCSIEDGLFFGGHLFIIEFNYDDKTQTWK